MNRNPLTRALAGAGAFAAAATLLAAPASAATVPESEGYFSRPQTWECSKLGTFEVAHFSDENDVIYLGGPTRAVKVEFVAGWFELTFGGETIRTIDVDPSGVKPLGHHDTCVVSGADEDVTVAGEVIVARSGRR